MKAVITNLGQVAVPLTSTQGVGLAVSLEPGVSYSLDDTGISVVVAGDNPSFADDLKEALQGLAETALRIITFWKAHPAPHEDSGHPSVSLRIVAGDNAIRVTGDDKDQDHEVPAGGSYDVRMLDYVELRQLGLANDPQAGPEAP